MDFDYSIDEIAESVILSLADMVFENRRLRKENKQLREDNNQYQKQINKHYENVNSMSAALLKTAMVGITIGKKQREEE